MEVTTGGLHVALPVDEPSRVGEARRLATQLAHDLGFDETDTGRVALVVTELANNLLRHARDGRLLIAARADCAEIEVIALDRGPGIADVARSLGDGFSTAGTPGTGLGAVRRLARSFDLHSAVPKGSAVVARLRPQQEVAHPADAGELYAGGISLAAPGERVCGDAWAFAADGARAALLVVDGLGHGPEAARAAQEAVQAFAHQPWDPPRELLRRTHEALRSTRGAALAVLHADAAAGVVHSAGVGNVVARLVSGTSDRTLLSQHGTAGLQIRTPEEITTPWPAHALVVMHTDGIETRWSPQVLQPVIGRDPALAAALLVRDHCRGRDDATVAVLRRRD